MNDRPTVAVVGASRDRSKYGNISTRAHQQQGYQVFPVNPYAEQIEGLTAYASLAAIPIDSFDRVTVYLPPDQTVDLLDEIEQLQIDEVWLNPGSADADVRARAADLGVPVIEGCSIVDLGVTPHAVR